MVGIVIVSHSARLAAGVQELIEQMTQGRVRTAAAGGIDDPENPIGTDPLKVVEAIQSVYDAAGVVVLMDLGSALLSADMALEFIPPEWRDHVHLCEAPLVEGAVAAAVQASVGGSAAQVMAEARGALAAKMQQLGYETAPDAAAAPTAAATEPGERLARRTQTFVIRNALGLHARPAAQFVTAANRFAATLTVRKGERQANAKSINQVATLGVRQGDAIVVTAQGEDAAAALAALQALVAANFGEGEAVAPEPVAPVVTVVDAAAAPAAGTGWAGIPAAPGMAIGPIFQYRPTLPPVVTRSVSDTAGEWQRLQTAIAAAAAELSELETTAAAQVGSAEAAIFSAHRLFLLDPTLQEDARQRLEQQQINAEAAWEQAIAALADSYRHLEDAYMQARAVDVLDAGQRTLRQLMGLKMRPLVLPHAAIVAARDLTPSDTAQLDPRQVLGICTELGGATSHSAILARALGIPAVVGLGPQLQTLADGQIVGLDGSAGRVWPQPDAATAASLAQQRQAWLAGQQQARAAAQAAAITQDGRRIEIAANIGGPHDVAVAREYGAEGVGLFRTEFLFLDRETAPDEAEQFAVYQAVAQAMGDCPVIVRTLDVGGDKPLPYLDLGAEENPFLGWRGIRFCLDRPQVFKPQLRAVLRASAGRRLKLMFPMIGSVTEVRAAKALLAEAQAELRAAGEPFAEDMEVGVMIEVPAAAAAADQLAREVDFFSIGTNDLTQYTMAADRGNARVAHLAQALQPAVLRLIDQTVRAGHDAGIWVGMCGELAGNAQAAPLLVGLGLDELSMSAPAIPAVKAAIRRITLAQARQIAAAALQLDTAEAVQAYLDNLH